MYAPKFRSWMSSWDRFEEAQEARLQAQGDAILADVRRQVAEAMPKEPEPVCNPYQKQLEALRIARSPTYLLQYLGGIGSSPLADYLLRPSSYTSR